METWNVAAQATLDRTLGDSEAIRLGKRIAGKAITSVSVDGARFRVTAYVGSVEPRQALDDFVRTSGLVLSDAGYAVLRWEGLEVFSVEESARRVEKASVPPTLPASAFADLCGVSKQRIYELDAERRKAAAEGKDHPFPAPAVPGWWLHATARRYAATRKRTPGPPKRTG